MEVFLHLLHTPKISYFNMSLSTIHIKHNQDIIKILICPKFYFVISLSPKSMWRKLLLNKYEENPTESRLKICVIFHEKSEN